MKRIPEKTGLTRFNRDEIIPDLLLYLLFFFTYISIVSLSFSTTFRGGNLSLPPYFLAIPGASFFILRRISMRQELLITLFLSSVLLMLSSFLFLPFEESVSLVLWALLLAVFSIAPRYTSGRSIKVSYDQLGFSMLFHGSVLALSGLTPDTSILKHALLAHALLSLCLFFAARQHHTFYSDYAHIANSPTQPSASVRRKHNGIILFLFLFALLIVPIVVMFPYSAMTDFLRFLLRKALEGLVAFSEWLKKMHLLPEFEQIAEPETTGLAPVTEENPLLNKTLEILLGVLSVGIVLVFAFFAVRGLIRFLLSMYRRYPLFNKEPSDSRIIDEVFSIEKGPKRRRKRLDFGTGPERDVRRKYYRLVRKAMRSGARIESSDSPAEILDEVSGFTDADFVLLTVHYEKIRYGNGVIPASKDCPGLESIED
ncbi:MAG: hypothetical protein GXY43_05825 [Clostridiaceae bacterium]|nr:hypothetical protein [Clostridiaceae bacterium]